MHETLDADVCIVGAGIAGLFAACCLSSGLRVVVVDKGTMGEGSSPLAQGGMAAAVGHEDSSDRHLSDTVAAGDGLVNLQAAEILCAEAPERVQELVELGCRFDRSEDGSLHMAREGGQSVSRSVHRADATGAEIVRALRAAARPRVERLEAYAFELASDGARCVGVWALADGRVVLVRAPATLLASGGAGALFASTTNAPASTGDAVALGRRAGARLADLEFVQFHPTALAVAESPRPLLTEALRGAGAYLVDASGARFMEGRHPDLELAPRHVVTAAILSVGEAFLDARHLGAEVLLAEFPTVVESCRARGFDPAVDLLPVAPAAHYLIGGVATDLDARTSIPGLFAAGECATTGVHGANRMAGNSLSEAVVFGRRAALAIAAEHGAPDEGTPLPLDPQFIPENGGDPRPRNDVVEAVTLGAGPIRDAESARRALARLAGLWSEEDSIGTRPSLERRAMLETGKLMVEAAAVREETRGVHVRSDFPERLAALDGAHLTWEPDRGFGFDRSG